MEDDDHSLFYWEEDAGSFLYDTSLTGKKIFLKCQMILPAELSLGRAIHNKGPEPSAWMIAES